MRIVPPIRPIRDGKILDVNLINQIINRTEYGAELLARYKMVAGSNIFVEQAGNGLGVSYLTALAGGAGNPVESGSAGTGSGGAGTGKGGAGTGSGGSGTPQPASGNMYIGIAASTGAQVSIQSITGIRINGQTANIGNILGTAIQGENVYSFVLTTNLQQQVGAIWASNKVSSSSFTAQFTYLIAGDQQADGITLIFSPEIFLGGQGGGLGYQGGPTNSVAVEIDIFQNPYDPNNSHIAVLKGGDVTTHLAIASPTVRPSGILSVTYSNKILNVFHNGIQIISHGIDIPSIIG